MGYLDSIKSFFLKKTYDFDRPDISLYNFHPQLRILLALKGIFFKNRNSKLRFLVPGYFTLLTFVGIGFESMYVHRGLTIKDYSFATECLCYCLIIGSTPLVYACLFYNKEKVIEVFENINEEFKFVCSLGPRHRTPFLKGQLLIWKLCYAWFILASCTTSMFMVFPVLALIYQTLFVTHTENTIRPLAFPMWLPNDDPYRTPNYEIFLVFQINFCIIILQTFGVYIYTLFHILLHYYFILEMIEIDFGIIFEGLDQSVANLPSTHPERKQVQMILNRRIKRIVTWHRSVITIINTLSAVYGPTLVYQILVSSFLICLIGYQIAEIAIKHPHARYILSAIISIKICGYWHYLSNKYLSLDHGTIEFLFIMLGVCTCLQVFIPCYLGTVLRNKVFSVGDACWNCGWHANSLGKLVRLDIVIIIIRTQMPLLIKFTGISAVQLETFSSMMSAAYSYFNMLRNSN